MFRALSSLAGALDWKLVLTAGAVSFLASLVALALIDRAHAGAGRARLGFIAAAGVTAGCGIFATYLIVMLATTPGGTRGFDGGLTAWSSAAAAAVTVAGIMLGFGVTAPRSDQRFHRHSTQLEAALNNMSQGLVMIDASERVVVCNQSYLQMYGLSPDIVRPGCTLRDLLRHRIATNTLSAGLEEHRREVVAAAAQGKIVKMERELPDGRTVSVVLKPLAGSGWVATHDDVTQRRQAEQAVIAARAEAERAEQAARAAHARLLDAFEVVPEGIALFDAEDRYVLWNRRFGEIYCDDHLAIGMRFEETLRAGLAGGRYAQAQGREEAWLAERLARHAEPRNTQEQQLIGDRWVRIEERRTSDGGSVGVRIDITDLKRREASFRFLFDGNPLPMWVCDRESLRFLAVNDAAVEHYGYAREQFLTMTLFDVRPTADRDELIAFMGSEEAAHNAGRIWRHIKADGTCIEVAAYARWLRYADRPASLVACIDVTEQRKAERSLTEARAGAERAEQEARAAHALLRDAFEVVPEGLVLLDADDRFVLWNSRYAELCGDSKNLLQAGVRFEDVLREGLASGRYPEAVGREDAWLAERLARHREPRNVYEQSMPGDRWLRIEQRPTAAGGSVGVRIDITDLKQREASFRLLFDGNPVPMWVYDLETLRFLAVNDAAVEHYGYSREQFLAKSLLDIRPAEDRDAVLEFIRSDDRGAGRVRRHVKADGGQIEMAVYGRSLRYANRAAALVAGIDVTQRKRAEDELRRTRKFLDTVVENIPATLIVKDARDLSLMLINKAGEDLFDVNRADLIGKTVHEAFPKPLADILDARDRDALSCAYQVVEDDQPIDTPHNGVRLVTGKQIVIRDEHGEAEYLLGVIEDVTERRRAESQIEHMAHHDVLTGLPNRAAFVERLRSTLDQAASGSNFAVLCLDLDRFKEVNDVFGNLIGDALLCEVSRRLQKAGEGAFLARVGGDEFTLIATDGPQPSTAATLADRLQAAAMDDIEIDGHDLRIGLSIGVAIFPTDGADATTLVGNADAALCRAKAEGRETIRFFAADMDKRLRERRALQQDLRSAVARSELMLHYQPQARIGGQVIGFEALVRWQHPSRGMVSPATFIPLAEDSGLIISIGEWILREACREAASWPRPMQIAINLSPVQFRHGDLAGLVHSVLLETGLDPSRVELEITEGVLIGDHSRALSILRRLKSLGVRIAMDDFGTGYSSLSYLQSFPFDKIKIDQAFTANVERNPQSAAIIRAVIALGRGLALPVVAEGVETSDQLAFLTREACDQVQGYLIGRPAPIEHYGELIGRPGARSDVLAVAG